MASELRAEQPTERDVGLAKLLVAFLVGMQLLLTAFPRPEAALSRIVWPFSTGHMFNFHPQGAGPRADAIRYHQLVLLDGDNERILKISEVVHPNLFAFLNTMKFRMRDGTWTERQTLGLTKAVQTYRCKKGMSGSAFAIYALDWSQGDLLSGNTKPFARTRVATFPLPECPARPPT